jgi:hypothetical protein
MMSFVNQWFRRFDTWDIADLDHAHLDIVEKTSHPDKPKSGEQGPQVMAVGHVAKPKGRMPEGPMQ